MVKTKGEREDQRNLDYKSSLREIRVRCRAEDWCSNGVFRLPISSVGAQTELTFKKLCLFFP